MMHPVSVYTPSGTAMLVRQGVCGLLLLAPGLLLLLLTHLQNLVHYLLHQLLLGSLKLLGSGLRSTMLQRNAFHTPLHIETKLFSHPAATG